MTRKAWDQIKGILYRYEELFLGGDYSKRPHESIQYWFRLKLKNQIEVKAPSMFVPQDESYKHAETVYLSSIPTGQDGATMVATLIAGLVRLSTIVTRGEYIGIEGISTTPATFAKFGYDTIKLVEVDTDEPITSSRVLDRNREVTLDESPVEGFAYTSIVEKPDA